MSNVSMYLPERDYSDKVFYFKGQRSNANKKSKYVDTGCGVYAGSGMKKKNTVREVYHCIIAVLIMILFVQIALHFLVFPKFIINHVNLKMDDSIPITDSEILEMAGMNKTNYFFIMNALEVKNRLLSSSLIKDVRVEKIFPDTVNIAITGRKPIVASVLVVKGRSVPVFFDNEGVLLNLRNKKIDNNIPVLSGIKFAHMEFGQKLPADVVGFIKHVDKLKTDSPDLYNSISEFRFIKTDDGKYEVLLYLIGKAVRIRIGRELNDFLLKNIMMVLDVISRSNFTGKIDELDFRTGEVVYRIKEG